MTHTDTSDVVLDLTLIGSSGQFNETRRHSAGSKQTEYRPSDARTLCQVPSLLLIGRYPPR